MSTIGIIGAGQIGGAFATALARNAVRAVIANSRGPETLAPLVRTLSPYVTAVTREVAAGQDMVLVAVPWARLDEALAGLDLTGRIVIDANNAIAPGFKPANLGGRTSSRAFADMARGARVVKAFNHLQPGLIAGDPRTNGGRRVLFMAGDDPGAKNEVGQLMDRLGFYPIDLGSIDEGSKLSQFPGGPLPVHEIVLLR